MTTEEKIARIRLGGKPRVIDLFAGCGGLSLGFHSSGFEIIGAVEFDQDAARTHAINFYKNHSNEIIDLHSKARDITKLEPDELLRDLGLTGDSDRHVDVIVGGPPCQAFARVGRAKLREVAEHPEAYLQDPRGNLYLRYIEYVRELKPVVILMENVPDVLNYGGHNIAEEVCDVFENLGYKCKYTLLNSVYYGVPQMRERMFLLAYAKELDIEVQFPKPSHWIDLPIGYHNSRQVALKTVKLDLFDNKTFYTNPPRAANNLTPAISANAATSDLPKILKHLTGDLKRGARRFNEMIKYVEPTELNPYVELMRTWEGFEGTSEIRDHVIRSLPRDYKIFAKMKPGDQYPEAYEIANKLFDAQIKKVRKNGTSISERSKEFKTLKDQFVPPYDPSKFPNKWRKMESDQPSRTLLAHLGKDGYSHIHYDSSQARTISVREAARLQSFPDGFIFSGTMNPAFKQIGNSVPPLMAKAIAIRIFNSLIKDNVKKISSKETYSVRPYAV